MSEKTIDLDAALGSLADKIDNPSWDEMVSQAEKLPATQKAPVGDQGGNPSSKHSRRGGYSQRGGSQRWGKGKAKESAVVATTTFSQAPETLSSTLAKIPERPSPAAPSVNAGLEEDVDKLSTVTSSHAEDIEGLKQELSKAQQRIIDLETDQKDIMSELSALRKEIHLMNSKMSPKYPKSPASEVAGTSGPKISPARELIQAAPYSPETGASSVVAKGPSWKKKLNF